MQIVSSDPTILSNVETYYAIAKEAYEVAVAMEKKHVRPKQDGSPGSVLLPDPQKRSFKQSLIAIVFSGVYLESLLYLCLIQKFGRPRTDRELDRKSYEEQLSLLGIDDAALLKDAEKFRKTRREVVHEKAIVIGDKSLRETRAAQREAEFAISFVDRVRSKLV